MSGPLDSPAPGPEPRPTVFVALGGGGLAGLAIQEAHRRAQEISGHLVVGGASLGDEPQTRSVIRQLVDRSDDTLEVRIDLDRPARFLAEARRRSARLVVFGEPSRALTWGRAPRLVRDAPGPTLVTRPRAPSGRILVATDLRDPNFPALMAAARERERLDGRVVALHCVAPIFEFPGPSFGLSWSLGSPAAPEATASRMDTLARAVAQTQLEADLKVIDGDPRSQVLAWVESFRPELLVLGHRQKSRWQRWLDGSTSERLATTARCSVLVVPLSVPPSGDPTIGRA